MPRRKSSSSSPDRRSPFPTPYFRFPFSVFRFSPSLRPPHSDFRFPISAFPMSILVSPETKILVQGITGDFGARHARLSLDYGTHVVAGVTPGKGGQWFEHGTHRVPIFNSVADAARATGATVSAIFVPPPFAADAILEGA